MRLNAVYQYSTLTVAASGSDTIYPCQCNTVYKNLSITVKPMVVTTNTRYNVYVLFGGEIVESHSFSSASERVIANMSYPNKLFPPNLGTGTIPKFYANGQAAPNPLPVTLRIVNFEALARQYEIYTTFEEFEMPRCMILDHS